MVSNCLGNKESKSIYVYTSHKTITYGSCSPMEIGDFFFLLHAIAHNSISMTFMTDSMHYFLLEFIGWQHNESAKENDAYHFLLHDKS